MSNAPKVNPFNQFYKLQIADFYILTIAKQNKVSYVIIIISYLLNPYDKYMPYVLYISIALVCCVDNFSLALFNFTGAIKDSSYIFQCFKHAPTSLHLPFSSTVLVLAQSDLPPDITKIETFYQPFENTTRGTVLFNITAKYRDGHRHVKVVVEANSLKYVQVQQVNGSDGVWSVILNTELDREVSLETGVAKIKLEKHKCRQLPLTSKCKSNFFT